MKRNNGKFKYIYFSLQIGLSCLILLLIGFNEAKVNTGHKLWLSEEKIYSTETVISFAKSILLPENR